MVACEFFDQLALERGRAITLSVVNRAPHPNAAKLFINRFLSREGQLALQTSGRPGENPNARRIDIAKEIVSPQNRLIEGGKYTDIKRDEWQDMSPIVKLAKQILSEGSEK
jgi:ABC-type Fe3+ transport system substrate-binding protein